ncbi:MAG: radical SAM protein [Oscillospiraceae bacterium]|jgi:nitrogen fixation protein NifB|nr:radical SAM protein [Oscillospiraceae bacterium]
MKLAFATRDGEFVSAHFGRAPFFVIVEINAADYTWDFEPPRETPEPCELGNHDSGKLRERVESLSGCNVLFASRVGGYAYNLLTREGIQVLEQTGHIEQLTEDYIRYLKRPKFTPRRRDIMDDHPCFSEKAHNASGRLHLPVSPACNIQCRFCSRSQNTSENRPGVAGGILRPEDAPATVRRALKLCPEITVVGIAGPGDTLATGHAIETFRLVHREYPELIKCLSTNGLALPGKAGELRDAGVRSVTVTVNAADGDTLRGVVSWVKGGADLISAQLAGIRECVDAGMTVKVNTVLIPGVNDARIADIAEAAAKAGASRHNILPLIPQNEFAGTPEPTCEQIEKARREAGRHLEQFRHCKHCRADACGIPGVSDLSSALYGGAQMETFSHG